MKSLLSKSVFIIAASCISLSCEQYGYTSPLPGILEIRLRSVNNRQDLLPFSPDNNFPVNVTLLQVKTPSEAILPVYADLNAIRRDPESLYLFNCLDTLARDSSYILGQAYAPPGVFTAIEMRVLPLSFGRSRPVVTVYNGPIENEIEVVVPPLTSDFYRLPAAGQSLSIPIEENRVTLVTLAIDLDSTLVQRTETFEYRPKFYVTSVRMN